MAIEVREVSIEEVGETVTLEGWRSTWEEDPREFIAGITDETGKIIDLISTWETVQAMCTEIEDGGSLLVWGSDGDNWPPSRIADMARHEIELYEDCFG